MSSCKLQLEDVVRTRATLHAGRRRRCGQRHAVEDLRHQINVDASDGKSQTKTPDMVIGYRLSVRTHKHEASRHLAPAEERITTEMLAVAAAVLLLHIVTFVAASDHAGDAWGPAGSPECISTAHALELGKWVRQSQCDQARRQDDEARATLHEAMCSRGDAQAADDGTQRTWQPSACHLHLFTSPTDACALVRRVGGVRIVGDSLMRQLYQGLLEVLTGDFEHGSLTARTAARNRTHSPECRGTMHYKEKAKCVQLLRPLNEEPIPCGLTADGATVWAYDDVLRLNGDLWSAEHLLTHVLEGHHEIDRHDGYNGSVWGSMRTHTHAKNPALFETSYHPPSLPAAGVVVLGVGLHDQLNTTRVDAVLQSFGRHVARLPANERPRLLWLPYTAVGRLKPQQYAVSQGNRNVMAFNAATSATARRCGFDVLDFFEMSRFAHSYDGTHYGQAVNVNKALALLNWIRSGYK